ILAAFSPPRRIGMRGSTEELLTCRGTVPMAESSLPEESIFLQALEILSAAERTAYLDRACGEDRQLRQAVEALLDANEKSGDLLDLSEKPAVTMDEQPTMERPGTLIGPYKLL